MGERRERERKIEGEEEREGGGSTKRKREIHYVNRINRCTNLYTVNVTEG